MKVEEFDYLLPENLIAQTPLDNRSSSRLLILNKDSGEIKHRHFYDIVEEIDKNSLLVLNDTKVLPSRIYGKKIDTKANIELLLLKECSGYWEVLVRPARRVHLGTVIDFSSLLQAEVIKKLDDGICHVAFKYQGIFMEILEKLGEMPLPPYIHEKLKDKDRYQTIYAKQLGSAASPTAGLHFTDEVLKSLKKKGIEICYVTLHIGLGTFRPVSCNDIEEHHMHSEHYQISEEAAKLINKAIAEKRKIIGVGTTTVRTLESVYAKHGKIVPCSEDTNIFIYPGFKFMVVDELITNFHLPKSTLLMLVSAFSSKELILKAYQEAINEQYRFFSFGDCMYIKGKQNGY